jgi:hypothetical protein
MYWFSILSLDFIKKIVLKRFKKKWQARRLKWEQSPFHVPRTCMRFRSLHTTKKFWNPMKHQSDHAAPKIHTNTSLCIQPQPIQTRRKVLFYKMCRPRLRHRLDVTRARTQSVVPEFRYRWIKAWIMYWLESLMRSIVADDVKPHGLLLLLGCSFLCYCTSRMFSRRRARLGFRRMLQLVCALVRKCAGSTHRTNGLNSFSSL